MWITVNGSNAVELDDSVIRHVLGIYPEEDIANRRPLFKAGFEIGSIDFNDLKEECDKILIPWQFFFLNQTNLNSELEHIEKEREDKVSAKLMAKRRGAGNVTSKRIIDRLIRLQNYITENVPLVDNAFCGSLVGKSEHEAVSHIRDYFGIDPEDFWDYKRKSSALSYLIGRVEDKNINVCQGVLTNKILPTWQVVDNSVYKNTSGFVIKDDKIPFVFLPSEINPEETDGRQIYTLVYLLVVIGLNEYDYFIEKDFKAKALAAKGTPARIYRITSKLLLPESKTDELRGSVITWGVIEELTNTYKLTPTAILVTLKMRKVINQKTYESLLPEPYVPPKGAENKFGHPNIETSVRKFCGKHPFEHINSAIIGGAIESIRAQLLLIGRVDKKAYALYRSAIRP